MNTIKENNPNEVIVSDSKPFDIHRNDKNGSTSVTYYIPITERFGGKPEESQLMEALFEYSGINISQIAKQIGSINFDLMANHSGNEIYVQDTAAFVALMSQFIDGYTEFLDSLSRYKKQTLQSANNESQEEYLTRKQAENPSLDVQDCFQKFNDFSQAKENQPTEGELQNLANQLSEIMHNPALPPRLYDALGEEIAQFGTDVHSPENVLHNLKKLQKAG